jgi:protein involved in polysaccharide export with SLBB domain
MRHPLSVFAAVLTLASALLAQAPRPETTTIQTGDILAISVARNPDLPLSQEVTPQGTVQLPLLGDIKAQGLSLPEFEQAVLRAYSIYIVDPSVSVQRAQPKPR